MLKSSGLRFIIVTLLALFMFIPLTFVSEIIKERADYDRQTRSSVGQEWGGSQSLSGPVLVIPVEETVTLREKSQALDPDTGIPLTEEDGAAIYRYKDVERTLRREPVYLYPGQFDVQIDAQSDERRRGIFRVPVFSAVAQVAFDFPAAQASTALTGAERLLWDEAELHLHISTNRALRGVATLQADGIALPLEPLADPDSRSGGLRAPLGDPRGHQRYDLTLGFNGAEGLFIAPVGRDSQVRMTSDWPHPSFQGAFLPDSHSISDQGFEANWRIPHVARALHQISRQDNKAEARRETAFGVSLYQPNDFYQKAYRAARYGILFIGLTFLAIFLIEGARGRPTHPVQYILVGLAQSAFFLLMLALAEQLGFATAYLAAGGATVALLTLYGAIALKLGARTALLGGLLALLYGVLYLILRSADYALLAGSVLSFGAIAATMFATRHEDWYGAAPGASTRGWFRKAPQPPAPEPVKDI